MNGLSMGQVAGGTKPIELVLITVYFVYRK
jgi:hypothetical protein